MSKTLLEVFAEDEAPAEKPRINWASAPQAARKRPKLCVTVDRATIEALEAEYRRLGGVVSKGVIVERWLAAWRQAGTPRAG